jgi:hypothetical protein
LEREGYEGVRRKDRSQSAFIDICAIPHLGIGRVRLLTGLECFKVLFVAAGN